MNLIPWARDHFDEITVAAATKSETFRLFVVQSGRLSVVLSEISSMMGKFEAAVPVLLDGIRRTTCDSVLTRDGRLEYGCGCSRGSSCCGQVR